MIRHRRLRSFGAVLAGFMLAACGAPGDGDHEHDEPAVPVAAVEVAPRDLSRQVTVSAAVEPRIRVRLASRTDGTVEAVHFEEGDPVEAGEALVRLDMSEQRAEVRRARANLEEARQDYRRMAELHERSVVSPAEYQRSRAAVEVAESELELQEARLAFGILRAPEDMVVTDRHVEPGEGIQAREVALTLADMSRLVLRPGLSELDVAGLKSGQTVPVRLDALPDSAMEGRIRRIFPAADNTSRLVTVEVKLPEDAADRGVRPGYLGRMRMAVDERPEALAVPAAALGEQDGERYVYLIEDERLVYRVVETGVTRDQWTEVLSGLQAGDVVLATNPIDMEDGQRVRIVGWRG